MDQKTFDRVVSLVVANLQPTPEAHERVVLGNVATTLYSEKIRASLAEKNTLVAAVVAKLRSS